MKKIFYLLMFLYISGNAQLEMTADDLTLVVGDVIPRFIDTTGSVETDSGGADAVWMLQPVVEDQRDVLIDSLGALKELYPAGTIVTTNTFNNFVLSQSDTGMLMHGFYGEIPGIGISDTIVFDKPVLFTRFPTVHTGTIKDSYSFSTETDEVPSFLALLNFSKLRADITVTVIDTIDGYGTVQLPNAEFECLRSKRTETYQIDAEGFAQDSTWQQIPTQTLTSVLYRWFAKEAKLPVAELYDVNGESLFYYTSIRNTTSLKDYRHSTVKVYPNPVENLLNVDLPESYIGKKLQVQVFDILGNLALEEQVVGKKKLLFDNVNMQPGIYNLLIFNEVNKEFLRATISKN